MGIVLEAVHPYTDLSAAKSERGLQKMRRIEVGQVGLQANVEEAKVKLHKFAGEF